MKFYKNILASMLLFGLNPVAHSENTADSINFNGMCFNFRDSKPQELILTSYTGDGSDVVIPESHRKNNFSDDLQFLLICGTIVNGCNASCLTKIAEVLGRH